MSKNNEVFRVIIADGRNFDNYDSLVSTMDRFLKNINSPIAAVCGMARGADTMGESML